MLEPIDVKENARDAPTKQVEASKDNDSSDTNTPIANFKKKPNENTKPESKLIDRAFVQGNLIDMGNLRDNFNPFMQSQYYIRTYDLDLNTNMELKVETSLLGNQNQISLTKARLKSISILAHKRSMNRKGMQNLVKLKKHTEFNLFYDRNNIKYSLNFEDRNKRTINLVPHLNYHGLLSIYNAIREDLKSGSLLFESSFYVAIDYKWTFLNFLEFEKKLTKIKLIHSPESKYFYYLSISKNINELLKTLIDTRQLKEFIR
ncbi:hypothetical protein [Borrelia sp. P9F1]|uniref:hypothetical protein n=1 Tax=Borrelia sp. P9F1 TaxID=3058374 RepID=UPI002647FA6F|nr:hypothetical protein [Borrelia sp. P9F1]WKC58657.1 hypothetical protein QYZ68_05495 [Borrelia sp. P9F1]